MVSGLAIVLYRIYDESYCNRGHDSPPSSCVGTGKIVSSCFIAQQEDQMYLTSSSLYLQQCRRKNFFEDSKQDLLLFSASVIMGKWDRKRPGESPFSCQEKNLTITAVVSIIILHKALQLPQLYCPHLGTNSILFAFLCFDIQCTTEAFILCKKGKLMNAH